MTHPRHVVVIGGGFAGLSCAVALAGRGVRVTLLEARRTLGGRAGSFTDETSGETVDNGQHLFMACYRDTIRFLTAIGTRDRLRFQPRLTVDYLEAGRHSRLACPRLAAPWHLLAGVLVLKGPSAADRLALLRAAPELSRLRRDGAGIPARLSEISVTAWLDRMGQPAGIRRWLWHPVAIATLNESPDAAPASLLAAVLKEGFLGDASSSGLGVATVGLSDLYTAAASGFLERHGGRVRLAAPVTRLHARGGRVEAVEIRDGERLDADAVVAAIPPAALERLEAPVAGLDRFATSPILSVNLWLDRPVSEIADFEFACLIGGRVQWLFNRERILGGRAGHLAAVISAARDHVGRSNDELASLAEQDIRASLPSSRSFRVVRSMVVRERTATFSATVATEPLRPGPITPWGNLLLAGDWTWRGLPATIETAVRSGHRCADLLTGEAPAS